MNKRIPQQDTFHDRNKLLIEMPFGYTEANQLLPLENRYTNTARSLHMNDYQYHIMQKKNSKSLLRLLMLTDNHKLQHIYPTADTVTHILKLSNTDKQPSILLLQSFRLLLSNISIRNTFLILLPFSWPSLPRVNQVKVSILNALGQEHVQQCIHHVRPYHKWLLVTTPSAVFLDAWLTAA